MNLLFAASSTFTSIMYLRDIVDDSSQAGNMSLPKKREIYTIAILSRGLTIFQVMMTVERIFTIWNLRNSNRPSREDVLGFICKALLFEEGIEISNLALQMYLQWEMEVVKTSCMSEGLFLASASTSILEMIFGLMEAKMPLTNYNE